MHMQAMDRSWLLYENKEGMYKISIFNRVSVPVKFDFYLVFQINVAFYFFPVFNIDLILIMLFRNDQHYSNTYNLLSTCAEQKGQSENGYS